MATPCSDSVKLPSIPHTFRNTIPTFANFISAASLRKMSFVTHITLYTMLAMAPLAANAHMIMAQPVPFGAPDSKPLAPDGSDFPCKIGTPFGVNTMNNWSVGSMQKIAFVEKGEVGTAVHGGGSCQVSVTLDKTPTKDSKFKVIHSFEGGCPQPPANGGNYDQGGGIYPPALQFKVPDEVPNGEYTMAWSWENHTGNREFYMNCAPITVTGGKDDKAGFQSLPDMAIANVRAQGSTCDTKEGIDYEYENPGKYVTKAASKAFGPLCVSGSQGTGGGTGNTQPKAPAPPAPPAASPVASQAPAAPQAPSPSAAMSPSSNQQASTLHTVITVTAPSGPAPTPKDGSPAPAPPASPQASTAAAAPVAPAAPDAACSPDGAIVCSPDGTQFALCNFGRAVFQPVAAGTKCVGGKIARRGEVLETMRTVYV